MLFRQFVDDDLGCASYLIGDENAAVAALVDPAFAIEQYLEEAERKGVSIVRVLETHTHADHVSGHGRLALEHGVPVSAHPLGRPAYTFEPIEDGDELELGAVRLRVVHTPGHRPEHCAFVALAGSEPQLVLTGDSLFVGDAARPDLAVEGREGAEGLFHSLRRLAELPGAVGVYPGHVAGSLCGAAMSPERSSTIAAERSSNAALRYSELEDFVASSASVATPRPPNMERIVELNRGPFIGAPAPLGLIENEPGFTVLDVRDAEDHLAGHLLGAINVPVDGTAFSTKAAFVLSPEERIAIAASSQEQAERATRGLRAVGFLELAGVLEDAPAEERVDPVDLAELRELLPRDEVEVIDVREKDERDEGYIPGTRHIPYRLLRVGARELGLDRPVVTLCESGARAGVASSVLRAAGIDARPVIDGGIHAWRERGGRTVEFRRCGTV